MDLRQALQAWHDFYAVIAAASGTLLGAMFVVVSISSGFLTGERARLASFWMTPTVVNTSAIVIGCAVLLTPLVTWELLGALLGCACLSGLLYAAIIGRKIWRRRIDLDDRGGCDLSQSSVVMVSSVSCRCTAASSDSDHPPPVVC
jgi:hypothetical protein